MKLTEAQIKSHCGPRAMRRVRWYSVDEPARQGARISGQVGGFSVSARFAESLTSRCTCLYRSACDHVAVLLMQWVEQPDSFAVHDEDPFELPRTVEGVLSLLQQEDRILLGAPFRELFERAEWLPRSNPLWRWMDGDLEGALAGLLDAEQRGELVGMEVLAPFTGELRDRVIQRRQRRRALDRAERWRSTAPVEAVLVPLWKAAVEAVGDQPSRPPGFHGSVRLDATAEAFVFRLRSLPTLPLTVKLSETVLEEVGPMYRAEVAGILLDSVIGPMAPDVREAVIETLGTPQWRRALKRLDASLSLEGPVADEPTVGWKVEARDGRVLKVLPVALTPYKRKSGFRSRKLAVKTLRDLNTPADRAALAASKAGATPPLILEQLVGHRRVVGDEGGLLRVRQGLIEVDVQEGEGVDIALLLDGEPVPDSLLDALLPTDGAAAVVMGARVVLVTIGPVLEGLIEVLRQFGGRFPRAARTAITERLALFEGTVPLRLSGEIQGRELSADLTPILLLHPLSDGALQVQVRIQPLPGGPRVRPGQGASELARVDEGIRQFVRRELWDEAATVRRSVIDLKLPELEEWEGTLEHPDAALDLVWQLRQRTDVRVEWPAHRLRVVGDAEPAAVSVRATKRRDWFGVDGEVTAGKSTVRLKDLLQAIRAGRRYVEIEGQGWVRLTLDLQNAARAAAMVATEDEEPRMAPLAAARALLELEAGGARVEMPAEMRDLESRIQASDTVTSVAPSGLMATLRPYQLEGLTWLRRMACWAPGAVLADDMGLGKTLQSLAFLLDRAGPVLVVAPASVNLNWVREAERFVPSLPIAVYRGSKRQDLLENPRGILVTSYELLVRDTASLSDIPWDTVILDEAQALKNASTKRNKAARALDAKFLIALSGTPVENHILELWSLMRVVAPGLLGPKEFFHTRFGKAASTGDRLAQGKLGTLVKPFLLRRTKREVAPELPPREESVDWVELDALERVAYERIRQSAVRALTGDDEPDRMQVLAALTRLRQAACAGQLIDDSLQGQSSKIRRMLERVEAVVQAGEQALIFSQFTGLLDLAQAALAGQGVRLCRLDGSTPIVKRQAEVDRFQAGGADVFLISLKAGGTGLNLTAATTVLHLDPWWNPAAEDQASDRAHRIGQTSTVQVIRLVSAGTVEEQVLAMHREKRDMADRLLSGTRDTHRMRSGDLLTLLEV